MRLQLNDIRNYPQTNGTAQPDRYNAVLMGKKFSIIERQLADYIVFAQKLSAYLKFYNEKNEVAGTWENFLTGDVSFHLAKTASSKPLQWNETWSELTERIEGSLNNEEKHKRYLTWRFDFLYTLIGRFVDAYRHSASLPSWQKDLQALFVSANLPVIFELLEKYYQSSKDLLLQNAGNYVFKELETEERQKTITIIDINRPVLENVLFETKSFDGFTKFSFENNANVIEKVRSITEYLDELAQQLLQLYTRVFENALLNLEKSLVSFDEHQPHVALFYAFLKLSSLHRTEINSLLLRHLDFYYRQVLAVKPRAYQPSQAFVCFEPAKNTHEVLIPSGSRLSAGKDTASKDIFFSTQQDIVVNKAIIAETKSFTLLQHKEEEKNERIEDGENAGLFACASADSSDGNGKPLKPGQSWHPFAVSSAGFSCDAMIGISFYAALLHETPAPAVQNIFQIAITFDGNNAPPASLEEVARLYSLCRIKTDKEIKDITCEEVNYENNTLSFKISVPKKIKISPDSPNASFVFGKTSTPVNKDFFTNLLALQKSTVTGVSVKLIKQEIPVTKVKTIAGETDLSAAFPAFGPVPKAGSKFSIVAPILKNRTVSDLKATVEWDSATERDLDLQLTYKTGTGKISIPGSSDQGDSETVLTFLHESQSALITSQELKIGLQNDLGHRNYGRQVALAAMAAQDPAFKRQLVTELTKAISQLDDIKEELKDERGSKEFEYGNPKGKGKGSGVIKEIMKMVKEQLDFKIPDPPYTPMIKAITLTCSVEEKISFENIFYQYPFGYKKVSTAQYSFLPLLENEGEIYFGISNLLPQQSVSLLIQAEEGTADASLPNPETRWQYLMNNEWHSAENLQLKDGTRGLIQSGIVSFAAPDFASLSSTLLPAGKFWLRASVPFNQSKAVCRIFSLHTQAVSAGFVDNANDKSVLGQNFPANTITNLFPKLAAIKKVNQPFASFDGKKEEESEKLYSRTSERLRHKSRAVTAWDYEHIITDAFPEIYKAKVLNHASLIKEGDKQIIAATPGKIVILVTGFTAAQSALYRPMVSKSKITAISDYVKTRCSPFVSIAVMNPLFEEVKVTVSVSFAASVKDEKFYESKLNEDIKRFLSPWAFDNAVSPEFGGVVYRAALIDFIEELHYVDYIEQLELQHMGTLTGDMAVATSPASVIISAPDHVVSGKLQATETGNIFLQNIQSFV